MNSQLNHHCIAEEFSGVGSEYDMAGFNSVYIVGMINFFYLLRDFEFSLSRAFYFEFHLFNFLFFFVCVE